MCIRYRLSIRRISSMSMRVHVNVFEHTMNRRRLKLGAIAGVLIFTTYCLHANQPFKFGYDHQPFVFLETSDTTSLSSRISCSIESAAFHHPNADVAFYSLSPIFTEDIYRRVLQSVPNIKFKSLNVAEVFDGTPLHLWHISDALSNSSFPAYHLSDALRLALLWKNGGIYVDSDMIIMRPFDNFTNAVGYVFPGAGNNVLIFEQGHPFLLDCMTEFVASYRGDVYGAQGPELVSRVLEKRCGTTYLRPVVGKPEVCGGVTLQPYRTFFTHIWIDWKKAFFRPQEDYSKNYAMHLFGKLSENMTGVPGDGSLLDLTAKDFCPLTYQLMVMNNVL